MYVFELMYVDEGLPTGWKPYYIYAVMVDGVEVGRLTLREGTEEERYFDGHIGYSIHPKYRGHGYAAKATACLLNVAKKKGFTSLIITCSPDNIASKKTIEKLGATYIETKEVPKHLRHMFTKEEKEKEIYRITW